MATRVRALSAREVDAIKTPGAPRWVAPSLYLQIRGDGTRSWLFRYMRSGKPHWHGLGSTRDVGYQDARGKADELRVAVRRHGAHPVADRKAERQQAQATEAPSGAPTFQWCADQYVAAHEAGWKNDKHRAQWVSTIRDYAGPVIGKMAVDRIGVDEVEKVLKPIWTKKPETAGRLRGRISKVLGWAKAKGYRSGDDPAARDGPLDHLLPSLASFQKIDHHKAVPYVEVPALMVTLKALESTSAKALLWTILTAARTGETLEATWDEMDLKERLWRIPGERMKAGEQHWVPLSDTAVELLESLPRKGKLVFPGARKDKPLSNMAMLQCLRGLRDDRPTVHGFRSSFSTWAREQTDTAHEVIEAALAHGHDSKVVDAYARTSYLDKRRPLMGAWAGFVAGTASSKASE